MDEKIAILKQAAGIAFRRIIAELDAFALSKPEAGFNLIDPASQEIFRQIIVELHKTYCRKSQ